MRAIALASVSQIGAGGAGRARRAPAQIEVELLAGLQAVERAALCSWCSASISVRALVARAHPLQLDGLLGLAKLQREVGRALVEEL